MGLPLFIAPVESDTPQKCPHKSNTTSSPPRTAIRRLAHISAARERASLNRRSRQIDHHIRRRELPGIGELGVRTRVTPQAELEAVARYIALGFDSDWEYERNDATREQQRTLLMRLMHNRFGPRWQERDWTQPQQDLDSDWWSIEARLHLRRARLVRVMDNRRDAPANWMRPGAIDIISTDAWTEQASLPGNTEPDEPEPRIRNEMRFAPSYNEPLTWPPVPPEMNGLGDRQRSLSPEGWDTLLTTLTPDPQPPSANSSFVSNSASQSATNPSAAASSNTSISEPQQQPADSTQDQPCDSGCENSDTEQAEPPRLRRVRYRHHRHFHRVPRPSEPSNNPGAVRFWLPGSEPEGTSTPSNNRSPFSHAPSLPARAQPLETMEPRRPSPLRRNPSGELAGYPGSARRGIWIGRLSVGASDDEEPAPRSRRNREDSAGSGNNTGTGDDDILGWQRIVRSLAHRQDIPDEWWAEAGLSRTLSREARD